jgi:beta-phosphoglucomutase family hydrolase
MRRPKALIFDMDGTIVDNMRWHAVAWLALFEDQGCPTTEEEFYKTAGFTSAEVVRHFISPDLPEEEVRCLARQKEFLYRFLYKDHIKPVPGFRRLLKDARSHGCKVALATAAGDRNIRFTVHHLQLEDAFDAIAGASEVQRGKPEPDIFLLAASKLGVDPTDCVVFEDGRPGVQAARRAGMGSVAVATVHSLEELQAWPEVDWAIRDFREVTIPKLAHVLPAKA